MQSQGALSEFRFFKQSKQVAFDKWETLSDRQKKYASKAWSVITYKWRWQIALNIPYLMIFVLDRSIPAVHKFNMDLLSSLMAKLPIPEFLSSMIAAG